MRTSGRKGESGNADTCGRAGDGVKMGIFLRTFSMDGPNAVTLNFYRTITNYVNDTVINCTQNIFSQNESYLVTCKCVSWVGSYVIF